MYTSLKISEFVFPIKELIICSIKKYFFKIIFPDLKLGEYQINDQNDERVIENWNLLRADNTFAKYCDNDIIHIS